MAASFKFQRRGIVDLIDPSPSSSPLAGSAPAQPSTPSRTSFECCSLRAGISLFFDASTPTASMTLKLDAPVTLRNIEAQVSLTRAQRTNLSFNSCRPGARLAVALHIHPGQITSLAFSRQPSLPDRLVPVFHRLASREVLVLHLTLSSPPALVVPNVPGRLISHTRADLDVLKVFQRIAGAAAAAAAAAAATPRLALDLYLPSASLTDEQASNLCASLPLAFSTAPEPLNLQLSTLYGGLGARQIPPDQVASFIDLNSPTASPSSHDNTQSPPGYDASEPGRAPPSYSADQEEKAEKEETAAAVVAAANISTQGRKRPRWEGPSSPSSGASDKGTTTGTADASLLQALQQELAAAHHAIARLEALHAKSSARETALDARLAAADDKLAELAQATADYECAQEEAAAGTTASQQEAYVDERMDELRQELVQHLDDRLETFGLDVLERGEVEALVEEQVGAAMEDLRERLAGGVRLLLPR